MIDVRRLARALQLDADRAGDGWLVGTWLVDDATGCPCPDARIHGPMCKHRLRVALAVLDAELLHALRTLVSPTNGKTAGRPGDSPESVPKAVPGEGRFTASPVPASHEKGTAAEHVARVFGGPTATPRRAEIARPEQSQGHGSALERPSEAGLPLSAFAPPTRARRSGARRRAFGQGAA